jgi:hypothetical protein
MSRQDALETGDEDRYAPPRLETFAMDYSPTRCLIFLQLLK